MRNLKIMVIAMFIVGMLITKSNPALAAETSSSSAELYFVVESSETVSYKNPLLKSSNYILAQELRVKIYEKKTNAYVGTFLYIVKWNVNDGVSVKYVSREGKFEDTDISFGLGSPTVTYSGDYGYCRCKLHIYGYSGASSIMVGELVSYCDIYGEASGYLEQG